MKATETMVSSFFLQLIYVYRNPKDVLCSYFHFSNMLGSFKSTANIEEFMKDFLEGKGN